MLSGSRVTGHLAIVALGASVVWFASHSAPAVLGLLGIGGPRVSAWITAFPPLPLVAGILASVVIAGILSLAQERPQLHGLRGSLVLGLLFGAAAFVSRAFSAPDGLASIAFLVALLRTTSLLVAALVMYLLKRAWLGTSLPQEPARA